MCKIDYDCTALVDLTLGKENEERCAHKSAMANKSVRSFGLFYSFSSNGCHLLACHLRISACECSATITRQLFVAACYECVCLCVCVHVSIGLRSRSATRRL